MADPYATLGVARTASEAEIKKAYRKLAKELHPDRNTDNPRASARFSDVTNAYDLLTDKDKRARFDRGEIDAEGNPTSPFGGFAGGGNGGFGGRTAGPGGFAGGAGFGNDNVDLGDIFDGLFGSGAARGNGPRRQAAPPRGGAIAYRLAVPFVDAATQAPQRIKLADGKTIHLKLPAGLQSGAQMRLPGKGQPGPGGAGDAIVTVEVQGHAFFVRDGDDVRVDVPITLAEAVKGARIKVPTVDGAVMLAVPAGATSGRALRLKSKGFAKKRGGRGDQLVTLMIDLPAGDEALARFVEGWSDSRNVRQALGT